MFLTNLLTAVTSIVPSVGEIANISVRYEWICNVIAAIIGFAKDVGLGIILFTVILKLITLAQNGSHEGRPRKIAEAIRQK